MLTRFLRRVSVLCAWLVVVLAGLGAALTPVMGTILARMEKESVSIWTWLSLSALLLAVALGGYLLIRRKLLGLPLAALPAVQLLIEENVPAALVYLAVVSLIFGTPLALANFDKRSTSEAKSHET